MAPKGQIVGYVRVSTADQNADRQLEQMKVDRIFTDYVSGKDLDRPALKAMLDYVRDGDTIVVVSMDRLARNAEDLKQFVMEQNKRGIEVRFVKENLCFTGDDSPIANMLLSVLGALAQFERELIRERQREGIEIAQKKGKYRGRRKALTEEQVNEAQRRIALGEKKARVARHLGISRDTLYRSLRGMPS